MIHIFNINNKVTLAFNNRTYKAQIYIFIDLKDPKIRKKIITDLKSSNFLYQFSWELEYCDYKTLLKQVDYNLYDQILLE